MSKLWNKPAFIHYGLTPGGDDEVIGEGTGQSGDEIWPCSFEDWQIMFGEDLDGDGVLEFDEYLSWWKTNNFSEEDWYLFNPDDPFNP